MNTALELGLFLLGMGFTEVVIKPFSMKMVRKGIEILPRVFDKLDPIMPHRIQRLTPTEIEAEIYRAIEGEAHVAHIELSEKQKKALFDEFVSLYNPVIAASKIGRTSP